MFQDDYFYDISNSSWFLDDAIESAQRGMVKGTSDIAFSPYLNMTRAQAVTILARMEQADTDSAPVCPFTDVPQSEYYASAVNWAYANQIVQGISETQFAPNAPITRQELVTILIRYLTENRGMTLDSASLAFTDQAKIADYALESVQQAVAIGLIYGYPDGSFQPLNRLPRCEGVTILVRLVHYLEAAAAEPEEPETPEEPEDPDSQVEEPAESPEVGPSASLEPAPSSAPSEVPAPSTPENPDVSPAPSELPAEPTPTPEESAVPSVNAEIDSPPTPTP